jgi:hypothetical protein
MHLDDDGMAVVAMRKMMKALQPPPPFVGEKAPLAILFSSPPLSHIPEYHFFVSSTPPPPFYT